MEPILEVKNLCIDYKVSSGLIRACDNVSFTLYRGEIVGIIGESGSGKSTLAGGILQTIREPGRIASGEIFYCDPKGNRRDLLKLSEHEQNELRWTNITTVFQAAQNVLNPTLRIRDHFIETAHAHISHMTKEDILEHSKELLNKVRLEERVLDSYPHQLSGGMKQRVIIALSLLLEPDLLILDEPTTALDVITQWYIIDILRKLHKQTGLTMLFLTHDVSIIGSIADKLGVMYCAQMVEYSTLEELYESPKHPYSLGLLSAVPSLFDDITKRAAIPGNPPSLRDIPKGCRFGPRCSLAAKGDCDPEQLDWDEMVKINENQYTLCNKWKQVKKSVVN